MGQKIQLNESQLCNLIKESVKKAIMNEISTKMIARANKKFWDKYGGTDFPGPDAKDFPKDEHGNLLYPKDKKPLANHYREFSKAYDRALHDEQLNDPIRREAMEVWNRYQNDADWEPESNDDYDNEGCEISGHLEVDGWEFDAIGYGEYCGGGIEPVEVEEVEFKSPDGNIGWFSLKV